MTLSVCFLLLGFLFAVAISQPQNMLVSEEYEALMTIFNRWRISSSSASPSWNDTGDSKNVCSGGALGDHRIFDLNTFNPGILCDCSIYQNSTCHLSRLKAVDLGIVGPVPPELSTFKYLNNLNLGQNYLTGNLPAFFGNFTAMLYLNVAVNSLSGRIPKEIGMLRNLISLGIGINNFSGPLPPEIGDMAALEQIYLDNVGATGEIPPTFSKLVKLKTMFITDNNNLIGKIPEFIGNFRNLRGLRLYGNSLEGPIPNSFGNLNQMVDLRIGSLIGGTSSLSFISNLTLLSRLILRNCKISGLLPNFESNKHLSYLDLSFNNLIGTIPPSLFNLENLKYLYLGNNNLTGGLPNQKMSSINNIDLSYNELSGSLPFWISDNTLQLNLVANRFFINNSIQSVLPPGLNCLQKDYPRNHDSPIYYSFAINCGGDKIVESSDGIVFETDNEKLSSASYYVSDKRRWGVSNVGDFTDATDSDTFIKKSVSSINTSNSDLYKTARMSPSSLRYYGMGLENGNYTVKLYFMETEFSDDQTWESVGRRLFDIYIQGVVKAENFDIKKNAGASFRPVVMEYTTMVTRNFLDIHLFWASKGTTIVPDRTTYGPIVSALSATPNFRPTVSNQPPSRSKNHIPSIVGIVVGVSVLCFLLICCGFFVWRRKTLSISKYNEMTKLVAKAKYFTYNELVTATEGFHPSNKLGEGGFGSVFMGKLNDGTKIAVKELSVNSQQGNDQFIAEIDIISSIKHRNLVKLYGCCYEQNKRIIVYEYLENKSLDQALFGSKSLRLDWSKRFEICLGMARGIAYLHEESRVQIIHRDIKSSNMLLDADFTLKISDFGLARLYDNTITHITTGIAGTVGYLAPEYAMSGHLTEKVDVYAFGVTTFEILCGRPNNDQTMPEDRQYLLEWVWTLNDNKCVLQAMDSSLPSYNEEEAMRMFKTAFLCTQTQPMSRPPMSRVVAMLIGDAEITQEISKPSYLTDWETNDTTYDWNSMSSSTVEHYR